MSQKRFVIPYLRWWIGGLLFLVTVLNYIDRQTLAALSPYLKKEFNWSNEDYAFILNSFRVAYTIMQSVFGRILDTVGTQRGLFFSVTFYSVVAASGPRAGPVETGVAGVALSGTELTVWVCKGGPAVS